MSAADFPCRLLLLSVQPPDSHAVLVAELARQGCTVVAHGDCSSLVQHAQEQAPEALLLLCLAADAAVLDGWLDALAALSALAPGACLPGVCVAPHASPAQLQRMPELGLQVWLHALPAAAPLLSQLRWAGAQSRRLAALREELALSQRALDERKWTERAKGLLMAAQSLDEEQAFRLLRDSAMHAHLRLGEVARSVVRAAELAEAINLAGQQRMLSQRLLKLLAQRLAAVEPRRAKVLQAESCARGAANLARLQQLLPPAAPGELSEALVALTQAWAQLAALLPGRPQAGLLAQADRAAEQLLQAAERLTALIAAASPSRPLQLVNLCGRQRMLSQRVAKQALLAGLLPAAAGAADLAASLAGFEDGLLALEAAPLSSALIRQTQAEVRDEWLRLLRCLRQAQGSEAAAGLARSSEALLSLLDRLTAEYQQSLQVILG